MYSNIYKIIFIIELFSLITLNSQAQDIHFSQNYATPQFINPAMTGIMNGDVRASAVYRNQWSSIMPNAFRTIFANAELALPMANGYDHIGIGLMFYNDKAGDLGLGSNYVDVALAYNKAIGERSYLSAGIQGGVANRSFDATNAQASPDEVGGTGLENATTSIWRPNVGGGVLYYTNFAERNNIFIGGALYHVTSPNVSFFNDPVEKDQLKSKISAQAGGSFALARKMDIVPSLYFIKQGAHTKIDAGSFLRFIFARDRRTQLEKAFSIGSWLRLAGAEGISTDAIVLATKFDYNNISIGLSYDVTVSGLKAVNANRGGLEVALIYTAKTQQSRKRHSNLECPRF